ncbi:MAG TPA: hypothetical protein VN778_04330 [Verrucomicrobiae bacterium]|nr:hypothetical protein [Verrucomicrobiae bacterium]
MEQNVQEVQKVQETSSTNPLDDILNEWLCPNCPDREVLREEIQRGITSQQALMKHVGRFAMRYLEASVCEPGQTQAACGNQAVRGALSFIFEAQAILRDSRAS